MTFFTQKTLKVLALPLIYTGNVILKCKVFNNNNKKKNTPATTITKKKRRITKPFI